MRLRSLPPVLITFAICILLMSKSTAQGQWLINYRAAIKQMQSQQWNAAIANFREALKTKSRDTQQLQIQGGVTVPYYPHREMGICYYYLGHFDLAEMELRISLRHEPSERARSFLARVEKREAPASTKLGSGEVRQLRPEWRERIESFRAAKVNYEKRAEPSEPFGERLSVAVIHFETQGGAHLFKDLDPLDKITSAFVELGRFKVMERSKIEAVFEEQKLGQTGALDITTAAEVGKIAGAEVIILGSITRTVQVTSIDARAIDAETAEIIAAESETLQHRESGSAADVLQALAKKIADNFPIIEGYIVDREEAEVILDLGAASGGKLGMRCTIYREGEDIIHPVSGKVLGKKKVEIGEARITQVYEEFSTAQLVKGGAGEVQVGDRVVTK